jgi:hypothetical protein
MSLGAITVIAEFLRDPSLEEIFMEFRNEMEHNLWKERKKCCLEHYEVVEKIITLYKEAKSRDSWRTQMILAHAHHSGWYHLKQVRKLYKENRATFDIMRGFRKLFVWLHENPMNKHASHCYRMIEIQEEKEAKAEKAKEAVAKAEKAKEED